MVYDYEYSTSARILASNLPSGAKNNRKQIEKKQLKANTGIAEKLRSRWRKWMMREEL